MSQYADLSEFALPIPKPAIEGTWQAIQFEPDVLSGERFNVGVVFTQKGSRKPHARIVPGIGGFRALFGADGAENFAFLLQLLRELLLEQRKLASPSPQLTFTAKRYVGGNNPQEILDDLYADLVTIGHNRELVRDEGPAPDVVKTTKLRKDIERIARRKMGQQWSSIFREQPVELVDEAGKRHQIDLPIWRGSDLFTADLFGTIVSAKFKSPIYRSASLLEGYVNFEQAAKHVQRGRGALLILRPSYASGMYPKAVLDEIDNDIDRVTWPFLKDSRIKIHVGDTPEELADFALALAES